jgi:hypothetical protein
VTPEQFDLLVNLSASFLLFALFIVLVAAAVLFYYLGYGLRVARLNMPKFLADVDKKLGEIEELTYTKSEAALSGPIRSISAWEGLKTGTRVLLGRPYRPSLGASPAPPALRGSSAPPALGQGEPPAL